VSIERFLILFEPPVNHLDTHIHYALHQAKGSPSHSTETVLGSVCKAQVKMLLPPMAMAYAAPFAAAYLAIARVDGTLIHHAFLGRSLRTYRHELER
jgi:hypothetical protein